MKGSGQTPILMHAHDLSRAVWSELQLGSLSGVMPALLGLPVGRGGACRGDYLWDTRLPQSLSRSSVCRQLDICFDGRTAQEESDTLLASRKAGAEWVRCHRPDCDQRKQTVDCFGRGCLVVLNLE